LLQYAACRVPSKCPPLTNAVNQRGTIGSYLSIGTFLLAAILETTALAFLYAWLTAWITIGRFHYGAIGCNGTLMLFIAIATLIKKKNISTLVLAAALTFLVWDYFGMIRLIVV
jgi:hypothetical protein